MELFPSSVLANLTATVETHGHTWTVEGYPSRWTTMVSGHKLSIQYDDGGHRSAADPASSSTMFPELAPLLFKQQNRSPPGEPKEHLAPDGLRPERDPPVARL